MRLRVWVVATMTATSLSSQTFEVAGTVKSSFDGKPIPGALVFEDSIGTSTSEDGTFHIQLTEGTHELTCTYLGYEPQKRVVTGTATQVIVIEVRLNPTSEWLNTVVITSGKFDQRLSEVTVSMEVLHPGFIERSNNTNLEQTLDRVPGVGVIDGQPNIRGGAGYSYGAGSRVLILVDGLPILSGDAGFPSWGFLPIENISQVEVIKGAASALYGSAAMNGVINLRTAYPTAQPLTRINFFSGVYMNPRDNVTDEVASINGTDTTFVEKAWWGNAQPTFTGFSASHRQRFGQLDLVAGTFWLSEDNFKMGDYNRKGRFHLNTRYRFKGIDGLAVGINGSYERSQSATFFLWNGLGDELYKPLPNTITNNDGYKFTLDPFVTYLGKGGSAHRLLTRWYSNHNTTDRDQSVLSDLYYGEYQFQQAFDSLRLMITAGIAATYATVVAELYTEDSLHSSNAGAYVQADKRIGSRINLSAGARYEINRLDSVTESRPVFRAGLNYRVARFSFARASFGQGYRFPTIAEKFVRTDVGLLQIYPNPNLGSETGWTAEVGFKQGLAFSRWQGFADVAFFWQQYRDMMEFTFGGESGTLFGFQSINVGETRIRGVELSLGGSGVIGPFPLDLMAGYTYADPVFVSFDSAAMEQSSADYNVLKYRFRHTAKADVETRVGILRVGGAVRYYSFMEAMDRVFTIFVPGIAQFRSEHNDGDWVVDVRLGVQLGDADVWLIVSNVLNNEYTLRPALMEPPRNVMIRFHYDLKWNPPQR
jgi:iron complex outermembrane receptor protein